MSEDARFRKGFLLALVVAITATFVFVIRDFLMTIFVAAVFSGSMSATLSSDFVPVIPPPAMLMNARTRVLAMEETRFRKSSNVR